MLKMLSLFCCFRSAALFPPKINFRNHRSQKSCIRINLDICRPHQYIRSTTTVVYAFTLHSTRHTENYSKCGSTAPLPVAPTPSPAVTPPKAGPVNHIGEFIPLEAASIRTSPRHQIKVGIHKIANLQVDLGTA
ncbi:hypothetical protein BJ508DRAFT_89283 [Ascobolus immersus RN42]|uniref:Uncharacterized protein n=1 Tax=Ascobolus immersus RN42 TaxID=1160509 RepID=A0A3N4ILM7_ASCIM|nr:hypothetical protein BJ508DRAFT_89283 [Ascobolus immersus RN42]